MPFLARYDCGARNAVNNLDSIQGRLIFRADVERELQRAHTESRSIASFGYAPRRRELEIEFRENGAVYRYSGVRLWERDEFIAAPSKGNYLNRVFKARKHPYRVKSLPKGKCAWSGWHSQSHFSRRIFEPTA